MRFSFFDPDDLTEAQQAEFEAEDPYKEYPMFLFQVNEKGEPVRLIASDRIEPEDATFSRDLNWIMDELNKAYEDGKAGR